MIQRGRKSAKALAIVSTFPAEAMKRPPAPSHLTPEQADEWRAVVNSQPADWFPRDTHGMLAQYCRHAAAAKRIAEFIKAAEKKLAKNPLDAKNLDAYDKLLRMQDREGKALSSLATRMRLSQQSRYDRKIARNNREDASERRPWDED